MYAIFILTLKTLQDPAGILVHEKKMKITEADRRGNKAGFLPPNLAKPGQGISLFLLVTGLSAGPVSSCL